MSTVVSVGRVAFGLLRHPRRLRRWRHFLGKALGEEHPLAQRFRARTQGRRAVSGLPPRDVVVAVAASERLARTLEPEWRQVPVGGDAASEPALVLVEWSGGSGTAHDVGVQEVAQLVSGPLTAGTPVVLWDTAHGDLPYATVPQGVVVMVDDDARRAGYPGEVTVLGATFQQRAFSPRARARAHERNHPMRVVATAGARSTAAPTVGADVLSRALEELDVESTHAGDRRHWPVTVVLQADDDAAPSREIVEAAGTGSAVVTSTPAVAEALPGAVAAADPEEAAWALRVLERHAELRDRHAALSTRAAHRRWSASARAETLLAAAGLPGRPVASVSAVVPTMRPGQLDNVLDFIGRQDHPEVQLVLVTHGFGVAEPEVRARAAERGVSEVRVVPADASLTLGACMNLGVDASDGTHVAKMDDDNYYGRHYLSDLLLALEYTDAQVVGKWAHLAYLRSTDAVILRFPGVEHRYNRLVQGGTLLMRSEVARELRFEDLPRRVDTTFLEKVRAAEGRVYAADRFNFVSVRGHSREAHTWQISDQELLVKPSRVLFYGEPWAYADL